MRPLPPEPSPPPPPLPHPPEPSPPPVNDALRAQMLARLAANAARSPAVFPLVAEPGFPSVLVQSIVALGSLAAMSALVFLTRKSMAPRPPRPRPGVAEARPILLGVLPAEADDDDNGDELGRPPPPQAEELELQAAAVTTAVVQGQRLDRPPLAEVADEAASAAHETVEIGVAVGSSEAERTT